jgi:hypothetical protein
MLSVPIPHPGFTVAQYTLFLPRKRNITRYEGSNNGVDIGTSVITTLSVLILTVWRHNLICGKNLQNTRLKLRDLIFMQNITKKKKKAKRKKTNCL